MVNVNNGYGEWYSYSRGGDCQCEWYIGCGNFLDEAGNNQITINDPGGYLHGRIYDTQTHDSNGDSVGDSLLIGSGTYSSHTAGDGCSCWFNFFGVKICRRTCIGRAYCAVDDPAQKPGAPGGAGGYGGGGAGIPSGGTVAGTANTGGGSGTSWFSGPIEPGGSGIVIIRSPSAVTLSVGSGCNSTATDSPTGDKIAIFKVSDTLTIS
mgnify:CR=1 FL=1